MIANKYKIVSRISEGEFGEVFRGENIRSGEKVAIKFEHKMDNIKMLKNEAKILQYLKTKEGFPQLKWFGSNSESNFLVMNLLGLSIKNYVHNYNRLSLKTVLSIGIQMINIIKTLHENELIHRDIKPDNFLLGHGIYTNKLYLIDFGLCKRYNFKGSHIKRKNINSIIGSPNFVSINVHKGIEPSRRDDLESCIYIFIYMLKGNLSWFKLNDLNEVYALKRKIQYDITLPSFLKEIINYIRSIDFEIKPDYEYLISILNLTLRSNNLINNNEYEWNT
jgi:serine/threonine protein kinase